jgi:toxin ParE1/3/4
LKTSRKVEFTKTAKDDYAQILDYSAEKFGNQARRRYEALIAAAIEDLAADPVRASSRARPELSDDLRSYHLDHSRRRAIVEGDTVGRARHVVIYRQLTPDVIRVVRILHDAMEFSRHVPKN